MNHRPSNVSPSNDSPSNDCPLWFQVFPLNPKAMSLGELYGEYDLATDEWADGVLSSLMRSACAGDSRHSPCILHLLHLCLSLLVKPLVKNIKLLISVDILFHPINLVFFFR